MKWLRIAAYVFVVLALCLVITGLVIQHLQMQNVILEFRSDQEVKTRQIQRLDAGIEYQSRRAKFLITARDSIIRKHNRTLSNEVAYGIAETALYICEKYNINPVLLFSIGRQESRFEMRATSHKGAAGIYQIHPLTGRMLCDALNIEYRPEVLYDLKVNTQLAGKYLDYLHAEYRDLTLILIGYNAGPLWADRYRFNKKVELPSETVEYISYVTQYYGEFEQQLAFYIP